MFAYLSFELSYLLGISGAKDFNTAAGMALGRR